MNDTVHTVIQHLDPNPDWVVFDGSWPTPSPLSEALATSVARMVHRQDRTSATPEAEEALLAPFTDQHFDLILIGNPPIAMSDPRSVVASFKRVLKSGGRLFLMAPFHDAAPDITATRKAWRAAMESERLWVDWDTVVTRKADSREYMGSRHRHGDKPGEKKGAISAPDCYLYVSGIK